MYLPRQFAEPRVEELHRIMREHALAMLVTQTATGLDAHHLPFLLDPEQGACGRLLAHVARANPLWRELTDGSTVLVVFRGAHGYITPNWYPGKHETHRRVPTWNYEVVHAHGTLHIRDDEKFVRGDGASSAPRTWACAGRRRSLELPPSFGRWAEAGTTLLLVHRRGRPHHHGESDELDGSDRGRPL